MSSEPNTIRVLVVDDHPIVRKGIAALIEPEPDISVVGEAATGREALQQFRTLQPDITLMDLQMPEMNGFDAISAIRAESAQARIIVLTTYVGDVQVLRAIKAGARGYLLKNSLYKELLETIRAVHAGKRTMSDDATYQLAEHATDEALTAGEVRVLRLIAEGQANKEIAAKLFLSEGTIKGQIRSIMAKLGANDRTHAAMIAIKRGILDP